VIGLVVGGGVVGVLTLGCVVLVTAFLFFRPAEPPPGFAAEMPVLPGPPDRQFPVQPDFPLPPENPDQRAAGPVQWKVQDGGNGHYYEFVPGNLSWTEAKRSAEGRIFKGVRGHLATITSEQEKEFVRKSLPAHKAWLGGYQDTKAPDYSEPAGGWRWVTGEPWKYTNWSSMSPDEFVPGQNFLVLDPGAPPLDGTRWDDAEDNYAVAGYYVEYPAP
jgi:hypothetical protein